MVRNKNMPWGWLLLGILQEAGGIVTLHDIYVSIEEAHADSKETDSKIILPRLFTKNLVYGNRPIFQHTVRGCIALYKREGLVERIDRGVYRITDTGRKRLEWYQKCY